MKKLTLISLAILTVLAAISCSKPVDNSSPEAFVRDFVQTLKSGGNYQAYYLKEADFAEDESSQMTVVRFTDFVQENFMRRCANAHDLFKGKKLEIKSVELIPSERKAANFLRSVGTVHKAIVNVVLDDEELRLEIEEVIQVGEEYRLVLFAILVDFGTEKVGETIVG